MSTCTFLTRRGCEIDLDLATISTVYIVGIQIAIENVSKISYQECDRKDKAFKFRRIMNDFLQVNIEKRRRVQLRVHTSSQFLGPLFHRNLDVDRWGMPSFISRMFRSQLEVSLQHSSTAPRILIAQFTHADCLSGVIVNELSQLQLRQSPAIYKSTTLCS